MLARGPASIPSEVAVSGLKLSRCSATESRTALACASDAGADQAGVAFASIGVAAVAASAVNVSRRESSISGKVRSPLRRRKRPFRFHLQAIAVNAGDPDTLADGCGAAARAPFAVTDTDAAIVVIHLGDHGHDLSD